MKSPARADNTSTRQAKKAPEPSPTTAKKTATAAPLRTETAKTAAATKPAPAKTAAASKASAVKAAPKAAEPAKATPVKTAPAKVEPAKAMAPAAKAAPAAATAPSEKAVDGPPPVPARAASAPAPRGAVAAAAAKPPSRSEPLGLEEEQADAPAPPPRPAPPRVNVEFKAGDHVVYPTHGVGTVQGIEEMPVAGMSLKVIVVTFDENRMTLRVPVGKAASSGLRKLATNEAMTEALETLRGRARIKRTMWSRRAQEYEAKINSGDPIAIAEVVRDLHRNAGQPDQSFSERQIYEQALDRLAAELAAIDRTDKTTASDKLQAYLKAA
jgi:CarD family transcriptional regulator